MSVNTWLQPGTNAQKLKFFETKIMISNSEPTLSPLPTPNPAPTPISINIATPKPLKAIRPQHQKIENPEEIDE